jgi:hypothetical protein
MGENTGPSSSHFVKLVATHWLLRVVTWRASPAADADSSASGRPLAGRVLRARAAGGQGARRAAASAPSVRAADQGLRGVQRGHIRRARALCARVGRRPCAQQPARQLPARAAAPARVGRGAPVGAAAARIWASWATRRDSATAILVMHIRGACACQERQSGIGLWRQESCQPLSSGPRRCIGMQFAGGAVLGHVGRGLARPCKPARLDRAWPGSSRVCVCAGVAGDAA